MPLILPSRGLFHLKLKAVSSGKTDSTTINIANLFAPLPTDSTSPWGIMHSPHPITCGWFPKMTPEDMAYSHRMLGASWSRLNLWAGSYGKVTINGSSVTAYYMNGLTKKFATTLKEQGIYILGNME